MMLDGFSFFAGAITTYVVAILVMGIVLLIIERKNK